MKGARTRANILDVALSSARHNGLDALSIGQLAKRVGLSKSGLFAHFKSKQSLQLQVLDHGVEEFVNGVVRPAIKEPRGEPRLRAMFNRWLAWGSGPHQGGCIFIGAAVELDDRPGVVRDYLVEAQRAWTQTLARAVRIAQVEGHLSDEVDPDQMAFQIYGIMMVFHLYHRLLSAPEAKERARSAFEHLLDSNR